MDATVSFHSNPASRKRQQGNSSSAKINLKELTKVFNDHILANMQNPLYPLWSALNDSQRSYLLWWLGCPTSDRPAKEAYDARDERGINLLPILSKQIRLLSKFIEERRRYEEVIGQWSVGYLNHAIVVSLHQPLSEVLQGELLNLQEMEARARPLFSRKRSSKTPNRIMAQELVKHWLLSHNSPPSLTHIAIEQILDLAKQKTGIRFRVPDRETVRRTISDFKTNPQNKSFLTLLPAYAATICKAMS